MSNPNYCHLIYNFQFTEQIYNRMQKHFSNNTKATICLRLSKDFLNDSFDFVLGNIQDSPCLQLLNTNYSIKKS